MPIHTFYKASITTLNPGLIGSTVQPRRRHTIALVYTGDGCAEEWKPPIPEYLFVERARIADAFFGPDAESTDGEKTLTRRIRVVSDIAALCKMRHSTVAESHLIGTK